MSQVNYVLEVLVPFGSALLGAAVGFGGALVVNAGEYKRSAADDLRQLRDQKRERLRQAYVPFVRVALDVQNIAEQFVESAPPDLIDLALRERHNAEKFNQGLVTAIDAIAPLYVESGTEAVQEQFFVLHAAGTEFFKLRAAVLGGSQPASVDEIKACVQKVHVEANELRRLVCDQLWELEQPISPRSEAAQRSAESDPP